MSAVDVFPNIADAVRTWFRSRPGILDLADADHINLGAVQTSEPQVVVSRPGGPLDLSSDMPLIAADCWASTEPEAWALCAAVAFELLNIGHAGPVALTPSCTCLGASILGVPLVLDPNTNRPGYALSAVLVTRGII